MSYLDDLGTAFTWIAERVIAAGVISAVSNNPAEIIHHLERRLTNPPAIILAENLVPLTGREHGLVHSGGILLDRRADGRLYVRDEFGSRFRAALLPFYALWNEYLAEWRHTHEETPLP